MAMSPFDLSEQNSNIDNKLVAGLERLSRVFRSLLWGAAYKQQMSPTQLQILVFLQTHASVPANTRYLAAEFGVSTPTISDAVAKLEAKGLVVKSKLASDGRKHLLYLSPAGEQIALSSLPYLHPMANLFVDWTAKDKSRLWKTLLNTIRQMNATGLIRADRSCYSCASYERRGSGAYCTLIREGLQAEDLRLDCPDHAATQTL